MIVSPCSKRNAADHPIAPWRPSSEPHQVRADRSFVDKHQPGGIKHALLSHPTSECARHICALPLGRLQGFFKGDVVSVEKAPERAAAGFNPSLAQRCNRLYQSQVRLFGNQSQNFGGDSSSGEMLPPRGFGAALFLSCQRCSHLTAELTLTSKRSAASRRDAPVSTASITRSRKSYAST